MMGMELVEFPSATNERGVLVHKSFGKKNEIRGF